MPLRRRRDDDGSPRRLPGAGSVSLEPASPDPPAAVPNVLPAEPAVPILARPVEVLARFVTAAGALSFAEQVMQATQRDGADCYRSDDGSWWVAATLLLGEAREMAGLGDGRLHVRVEGGFSADRGWGDQPAPGSPVDLPDRTPAALLELVRVAGLHRGPSRPLREACVLVPGHLVRGVLERAQDLRLGVAYQLACLEPLYGDAQARTGTCYAVWLTAGTGPDQPPSGRGALPSALLSALADNPFALVCRSISRTTLISYGYTSPLSDGALARLAAASGDGAWLFAPPPDGCARVTWSGEPLDGVSLTELGPAHALIDLDGTQPYGESPDAVRGPAPRLLTLIPARAHAVPVDAMLVDDTDLESLPLLLAGDPLADAALLIRGADRHLLTAPGGLLVELAVGEPLTCVGPGNLYVPVGYRFDPPVGPVARAALFQPDNRIAQVMLRDTRLGYDLDTAEPVWRLWAGAVPRFDPHLPDSAIAYIEQAAAEVGDPGDNPRVTRITPPALPEDDANWRERAYQAELVREYATAAQLYARHNESLRAARMWEREAEEGR